VAFAPVRRLKVAEQVARTIREAIVGGRFRPGENLPSERDLADQFAVNRSTVREALQRLDAWGLVEMRHGGGTLVRDFLVETGLQLLPFLLAPGGVPDPDMVGDLLDMRVMWLDWTARRAAVRRDDAGLARLRDALAALERAGTPEAQQAADWAFFEALVDLTGNRVLALMANAIRQVYLENRTMFVALYAVGVVDLTDHRAAVEAIAQGDAAAAGAAMARHGERAVRLLRPGAPHV
jgi:DNA-binding FadR family transcriptional regulator